MKQISIREQDEFIKLGQALKKADLVSSGVEAKIVIQDGQVTVNGETELQRGKKLHDGDVSHMTEKQLRLLNNDY